MAFLLVFLAQVVVYLLIHRNYHPVNHQHKDPVLFPVVVVFPENLKLLLEIHQENQGDKLLREAQNNQMYQRHLIHGLHQDQEIQLM
jgi:hypothetical protein